MKKIIVVVCAVFVVYGAMGASRVPDKVDFDWGQNEVFDKDVSDVFTKSEYFHNREGTYGDGEGAIVAFVARKIYKNGGYFCATQIQAANENFNDHSWIDYYKNNFPCMSVCKPGFTGDDCETVIKNTDSVCNNNDFTTGVFRKSLLELLKKDGGSVGRFTEEMQALDYEHGYGTSDYNRNAWDTLLGVLEVKKHGLIVGPVKVQGRRTGVWGGYRSYMINAYTTKNSFLLCAAGYVEKNGDCVKGPSCDVAAQEALPLCDGYDENDYNSDEHTMDSRGTGANKCRYFYCSVSGYGFNGSNDKTCVSCDDKKKSYVDVNGVCQQCETGYIYNGTRCVVAKKITKEKMRECYMKRNPDDFKECVGN